MSDSDDTDLLLLIPPDFFLIQSPDIQDSDSDSFHPSHNEVHNSLVSDLISQVNDLESRVCMIETLDKSVAHCSSYNDDSLINQSINSLTESDLLRSQCLDQNIPNIVKSSTNSLMHDVFDKHQERNCNFLLEKHLSNLEDNRPTSEETQSSVNYLASPEIKLSVSDNLGLINEATIVTNDSKIPGCIPRPQSKQAKLFKEIDSFIENRTKKSTQSRTEINTLASNNYVNQEEPSMQEHISVDNQSLALPDVYQLLQEMEDTQKEIVEKLKFRGSQSPKSGDNSKSPLKLSSNVIKESETLPLVEMYSRPKSSKSDSNSYKPSFLERLKSMQGNKDGNKLNTQMDRNFPSQGSSTESSRIRDFKSRNFSPNRVQPSYSPINIVRANLSKKNSKSSIVDESQISPHKSFRRQLSFEGASLTDSIKLKHSTQGEENLAHQSEEKLLLPEPLVSNNIQLNRADFVPSLEEKFNYLTLQRTTDKLNLPTNLEKKSSDDYLKTKLSANNLLSLSELWNREPTFHSDDPNKLRQKLEEEKYRRQHCEQQIHVLQLKVLEDQEKLAVAIKVDQEKDNAILQITESWRQLNEHWRELEEQRHSLAQQLQEEKALNQSKTDDFAKKIERWEKEVSQALDLAAGYKEKCETIQSQMELLKNDTENKIKKMNNELQEVKDENEKVNNKNKTLLHQLKELQERIMEEEELLAKLKVEFEQSNLILSEQEAEINVLKELKDSLTCMIKEEKSRSGILEQQKISLQQAAEEALKKEKAAKDEARVSAERIEVARTELRALYQGQLESVVKEKLQEFQTQLEAAEAALKTELQIKERQWAEKANEQCRRLHDKLKVDKLRIEEACKEEMKKLQAKLTESERLRSLTESKLQEETNRRADIAHRLHSVMETQWREALNIISNPLQIRGENRSHDHEALERVRGGGGGEMKVQGSESSQSLANTEEPPFCRDGQLTYRASQPNDQELKKYIQMLLDRGAGNPIPNDSLQESFNQSMSADGSALGSRWVPMAVTSSNDPKDETQSGQNQRTGHSGKPPWK